MKSISLISFILYFFIGLSFETQHQSNLLTVLQIDNQARCMPKCLECQKGPNSCTKCTQGANCCNYACSKCQNQTTCTACQQGFQLNKQLNICVFQYSCQLIECVQCDEESVNCLLCDRGYYLNTQMKICEACPTKCLQCNNNYECTQCQNKTVWQDGACRSCLQNCQKCHIISTCDACQTGYFITQNGKCQKCQQNCKLCKSKKQCVECNSGYFLDLKVEECILCPRPCLQCKSQTQCTKCQIDYYFNPIAKQCQHCSQIQPHCLNCNLTEVQNVIQHKFNYLSQLSLQKSNNTQIQLAQVKCVKCQPKFYLNGSSCKLCPAHCNQCKNQSFCTQCSQQYFINQQNQCQFCAIYHCFACKNNSYCFVCDQGYYFKNTSTYPMCAKCSTGCDFCDDFGCNRCFTGFYLKNGNCYKCDAACTQCHESPIACLACLTGYFKNQISISQCFKCPQPCIQCKNMSSCNHCMPGYYLSKNLCKKCQIQGCDSCKNIQINQTLNKLSSSLEQLSQSIQNTQKCMRCSQGYYLKEQKCLKCMSNCKKCNDTAQCIQCQLHYYINSQNKTCSSCGLHCTRCRSIKDSISVCQDCEPGYSADYINSNCQPCLQNCQTCPPQSQNICLSCKIGYYTKNVNESNNKCEKCKQPCKLCAQQKQCQSCIMGYYLNAKDQCIKCKDGCQQCNQDGCFICEFGYKLQFTNLTCIKCKIDKCFKCQTNESLCDTCEDGYKNYSPKSIDQQMKLLQGNQLSQSNQSSVCYRCDESIQGCRSCQSPIKCTQCFSGLTLFDAQQNQISNSCKKESKLMVFYIVIGVLSLLVLILIGVILIVRYRKKKRVDGQYGSRSFIQSLIDKNDYSINSQDIISDRQQSRKGQQIII